MRFLRDKKFELTEKTQAKKSELQERASDEIRAVKLATDRLHRRPSTGGEWDAVAPEERNAHQRVAAATRGFLTAANVVSVSGAVLSGVGVKRAAEKKYVQATVLMGAGRSLDLIDGVIAHQTGTRSDKGAAIDAGLDKILSVGAMLRMVHDGRMPSVEAAAHGLQQVRIFRENVLIKNAGGEPNPSIEGKRGMAAFWIRCGGLVLAPALENTGYQHSADAIDKASQAFSMTALYYNQGAGDTYVSERLAIQEQQ